TASDDLLLALRLRQTIGPATRHPLGSSHAASAMLLNLSAHPFHPRLIGVRKCGEAPPLGDPLLFRLQRVMTFALCRMPPRGENPFQPSLRERWVKRMESISVPDFRSRCSRLAS